MLTKFQVFCYAAFDHLSAVHPALPWAVLTLICFLAVYCTRRFAPSAWLWLESKLGDSHVAQGLPATLAGAIVAAVATGGDIGQSWKGALAGAVAPMLHHALKSYNGADAVLDAAQAAALAPTPENKTAVVVTVKAAAIENAPTVLEKLTQVIAAAPPVPASPALPPTLPSVPSAPVVVVPVVVTDATPAAPTDTTVVAP